MHERVAAVGFLVEANPTKKKSKSSNKDWPCQVAIKRGVNSVKINEYFFK